jgi:hypothetical protein
VKNANSCFLVHKFQNAHHNFWFIRVNPIAPTRTFMGSVRKKLAGSLQARKLRKAAVAVRLIFPPSTLLQDTKRHVLSPVRSLK